MALSISTRRRALPAGLPQRIALIGDSTLWQDGLGEARLRASLTANGWANPKIWFYACIGKAILGNDDNGFDTLTNMSQARAALGVEPDLWYFNLGSNGNNSADATNTTRINTIMDNVAAAGSAKVIWNGLSQVTGYDGGASTEATRLHFNDVARPLVQARAFGRWADWYAYQKAIGDAGLWTDGVHMTTTGYDTKNTFIAAQAGAGGG